jgi:hypothetical protein
MTQNDLLSTEIRFRLLRSLAEIWLRISSEKVCPKRHQVPSVGMLP